MSKNRARLSILNRLLSFPTINGKHWSGSFGKEAVQVGDLVSLHSAPETKWYVSWVREIDRPNEDFPRCLLESIDDETLCWWENVGINIYDRKEVAANPHWQWNDRQFAFQDRWMRVCSKGYMVRPWSPVFGVDGSVSLNVRIRYGIDDYQNPIVFPNWKKVTVKMLAEYYQKCVAEYEATDKKTRRIEQLAAQPEEEGNG